MAESADALVAGVERLGEPWVVRVVTTRIDEWGRLDAAARAAAVTAAHAAGARAAARVAGELRALFVQSPAGQRSTPLEVVRSLRREATEVLAHAGVPPIERDPFEEHAFPDDVYGVVPRAVAELGDESLGDALLAWGVAKARIMRDAANRGGVER